MARITRSTEAVFRLSAFRGLNESPSGDAGLEPGEAAEMVNFKVTAEGNLQVRPGTRSLWTFPGPVEGLWEGAVGGRTARLCAAGGDLWELTDPGSANRLGSIGAGRCTFFTFGGRVYILTPKRYLVWTGHGQAADVAGYRPVVVVSASPTGGGTTLEEVNLLTGARRGFFSPTGSAKVFQLPEGELTRVDYVQVRATGERLSFTADLAAGKVTLAAAPAAGTNTLEIGWTKGSGDRGRVTAMACAELYSGTADNRVFLYGDGSGEARYSGVNYDGGADATYFPAGNVLKAAGDDSPVTGMVRHLTKLLVFKEKGAYCVQAETTQLADGRVIPVFFLTPIQREVGNICPGQVRLVDNDPWTVCGGGVYRWQSGGDYLTRDERTAQRVSQRVEDSLREMDLTRAAAFDDQERQEWYLSDGSVTLVHNYRRDSWYRYEDFPARCFGVLGGELHIGTADGRVCRVSRDYRNDDGAPIRALWRSGSMDFGQAHRRRWGRWLWIAMKPESGGAVAVTTRTDRRNDCPVSWARAAMMNYRNVNYGYWSFSTQRQPRVCRVRTRFGPAAYEQVLFLSRSASQTATILSVEGNVHTGRYTG